MATLNPNELYDTAQLAEITNLSEEFLTGLIGKAVKASVIKLKPGWKIYGSDMSRMGKLYHYQIEAEAHHQAFLRVRARDEAELAARRERGEL